jgi:DNA gyrase/topoisomerase IV subunit A
MRLRSLRRLEEMELNAERDALMKERADLADLLDSERRQWKRIGKELDEVRKSMARTPRLAPAGPSSPTRPRSRTSPTRR